jgi:hypothetical protein
MHHRLDANQVKEGAVGGLAIWFAVVLMTSGDIVDGKPVEMIVHPRKPPEPALRYRLLPDLADKKSGNAATLYRQASELAERLLPRDRRSIRRDVLERWLRSPLSDVPEAEARELVKNYGEVFATLRQAVRSGTRDWGMVETLTSNPGGWKLTELYPLDRSLMVVGLRARLALLDGDLPGAVDAAGIELAAARDLGEAPTLIQSLIGIAFAGRALDRIEEIIQHEKTPNLYWSLTQLPSPLIDVGDGLSGERLFLYAQYPGLFRLALGETSKPLSPAQMEKLAAEVLKEEPGAESADPHRKVRLSERILAKHDAAKKALISAGQLRDLIDSMPHLQVAVLHSLIEYDAMNDEVSRWHRIPFWQARPHLQKLEQAKRPDAESPAIPVSDALPATAIRLLESRLRIDRRIAALRCIDAIRYHAAEHQGQLPGKLEQITLVPIPIDPATGKSFQYSVENDAATLTGPALEPLTKGVEAVSYTVMIAPQGKR